MKRDVVIVGGGVAGLASGALLAKRGLCVTVLEKGNQPGGRAYTHREDGFILNYGAHAMYRPDSGLLVDVLARLGRPRIKTGYPDAMQSYWSDGGRFGAIGGRPHQVLTTKLFPLATRVRFAQVALAIRTASPDRVGEQTFGEWLDARTSDPVLRRFFRALATINTYARPAEALSAEFVLRHFQRNLFAKDYVGYMHGGWATMLDAFIEELERYGGELVTGATARLETDGVRVVAAVAGDRRYEADAFVLTLPPQDAPLVAEQSPALHDELAERADVEDVRALSIDLGFSRPVRKDLSFVFDIERDLYYSIHSEAAPDLAPPGGQMMHAMAYLSPEEAANERLLDARKDDLVAGLDRHFGDWRGAIAVQRTIRSGRVTSVRQTPAQRSKRVPLRSQSATNLFLAGDGRDLSYNLSEVALASAIEILEVVPWFMSSSRTRGALPHGTAVNR